MSPTSPSPEKVKQFVQFRLVFNVLTASAMVVLIAAIFTDLMGPIWLAHPLHLFFLLELVTLVALAAIMGKCPSCSKQVYRYPKFVKAPVKCPHCGFKA